ncbi:MAG: threonine ammonia-lyase [Lachnospiraceae bacterium]|nr:threonine ammonia-lyase [Lachnospiraceae bacterium]
MYTLEKFEEASEIVQNITSETKLIYSRYFSEQTGNKVYFKPENMQNTGAYKVRGNYYKLSKMSAADKEKGVITASAGNHALGIAYAAKKLSVDVTIVMPATMPLSKVHKVENYGANVILNGNCFEESYEYASRLAKEKDMPFIHPFNDLEVSIGNGTIAMEIFKELPTVDYILVPAGGGGLLAGVATLVRMLNPKIKVIGVQPSGANCIQESLRRGEPVMLDRISTIADGVAVKAPGEALFPYIKENVDDIITVEDHELIVAFVDLVENHRIIAENAGLLTIAALRHLDIKNKKVVSIISGGNMDIITLSSTVQHGLAMKDRVFTVSILLPDMPGELVKVATIISELKGNVIELEHNQFVSVNRNDAVELKITMEAYGTQHKNKIFEELVKKGYRPKIV